MPNPWTGKGNPYIRQGATWNSTWKSTPPTTQTENRHRHVSQHRRRGRAESGVTGHFHAGRGSYLRHGGDGMTGFWVLGSGVRLPGDRGRGFSSGQV